MKPRSGSTDAPSKAPRDRFEELETLYRTAPIGIGLVDRELRFVRVNEQLAEYAGMPREEMLGRTTAEVVPEIAPKTEPLYRRVLETGEPVLAVKVSGPTRTEPRRERHWLASYSPLEAGGEVVGVSIVVQDVTESQEQEDALEEQAAFERLLADLAYQLGVVEPEGVDELMRVTLRRMCEFLGAERSAVALFSAGAQRLSNDYVWVAEGLSAPPSLVGELASETHWFPQQTAGGDVLAVSSIDDLPAEAAEQKAFLQREGIQSCLLVPMKSGNRVSGALIFDTVSRPRTWPPELGRRLKPVASLMANTLARKHAEAEILGALVQVRESENRFRHVAENVPALFTYLGPDLRYRYSNRHHREVTGRPLEETVGRTVEEVLGKETANRLRPYLDRALAGEEVHWEYQLVTPKGRTRWFHGLSVPEVAEDGSVTGMFGLTTDITQIKETEQELRNTLAENERLRERLQAENVYLRDATRQLRGHGEIAGESAIMEAVLHQAEQVAATDSTVLLLGETGTGKNVLADHIHRLSDRSQRPMITVSCAALPTALVESELFGREKGAFTGALTRKIGRFELADHSSLLLDEVGDLPAETQVKLLRVLQSGQFERLGSTSTLKTDVRIIAATNRDLREAVREGSFREDLYYRLAVFPIAVPPLRERAEDIPSLVWRFVKEFANRQGKNIDTVSRRAMATLQAYPWPGNVRELRNFIERAVILTAGPTLHVQLSESSSSAPTPVTTLDEAQRRHIVGVLDRTSGRIRGAGGAAEILGIRASTLYDRMKKLGIDRPKK
jgi:PAS domain S-box-containing protein